MRLLAVAAMVVTALGLAACGGDDDDGGEDGGGSVGRDTEFDGSWQGTTSQGKPISFTVERGVVTEFSISWTYGGANCPILSNEISGPANVPIKDGAFTQRGVTGTFESETKASGTGRFPPDAASEPACKTADFTWKASSSG